MPTRYLLSETASTPASSRSRLHRPSPSSVLVSDDHAVVGQAHAAISQRIELGDQVLGVHPALERGPGVEIVERHRLEALQQLFGVAVDLLLFHSTPG